MAAVEFRASTGVAYTSSTSETKTITLTVPTQAQAGDLMVMHILHRHELTMPPGWAIAAKADHPWQTHILATKYVQAGEAGTNVLLQGVGTSGVFAAHIQVFSGAEVRVHSSKAEVYSGPAAIEADDQIPRLMIHRAEDIAVGSQTFGYAFTSSRSISYYGYTNTGTVSIAGNRLGVGYKKVSRVPDTTKGGMDNGAQNEDKTAIALVLVAGPVVTGNATKVTGQPADKVILFDWSTGALLDTAEPNETGDWVAAIPETDYGVTYIANGCQPITHGPYVAEVE